MIMNTKFFVLFETAKLLKEKGYNEECTFYYGDGIIRIERHLYTNKELSDNTPNWLFNECISAPTYHEVVDWLEEKGIYITCYAPLLKPVGRYGISVFNSNTDNTNDLGLCREAYPTREDALNAGILKALEMI